MEILKIKEFKTLNSWSEEDLIIETIKCMRDYLVNQDKKTNLGRHAWSIKELEDLIK